MYIYIFTYIYIYFNINILYIFMNLCIWTHPGAHLIVREPVSLHKKMS